MNGEATPSMFAGHSMLCPYEERNARMSGSGAVPGIEERSFDCVPRRAQTARRKKRGTPLPSCVRAGRMTAIERRDDTASSE